MKKRTLAFLLAISWLFISTFLLTIPGTKFPTDDWLSRIWFDKWVHIGLFALMVFLWCRTAFILIAGRTTLISYFLWITFLAFVYGVGMEFVQKYFVSNRSFDPGDIVADGLGCIAGCIFSWGRYIKK